MKNCTLCKEKLPLSEFNKKTRSKDGLQDVCRECNRARSRKYYADNLHSHRRVTATRAAKQKAILRGYTDEVKNNPCLDCGNTFIPFAMDFDHVRGEKIDDISKMVRSGCSLKKLREEIDKCDLVCANCHRIRTFNRMQASSI